MEPIDSAFKRYQTIKDDLISCGTSLVSEADVRLKVVDRIFVEVLGWPLAEVLTEDKSLDGFADYNFQVEERSRLIVEAKRDSRSLGCGLRPPKRGFLLDGPVFNSPAAQEGIQQAIRYCGAKSAELACITNGREWIIFRGNRLGDGKDVTKGVAFVFSDLDTVENEFKFFYDLLSHESACTYSYRPFFQEAEGQRIRTSSFKRALNKPGTARFLKPSELAADIDRVMTKFFDRLTGDHDPELLTECFVETDESRAADVQLARISEDIIRKAKALNTSGATALTQVIERATESRRHEFVVIVGTKGAGKTTFITRFFLKVLRPELAAVCVPIRINLANSPGDSKSIVEWLDSKLLEVAEKEIFRGEPPAFSDLQGIFYDDYKRLLKGSWSNLYESDRNEFKIKFGQRVEDRREQRPHEYIAGLIRHAVNNRKHLPVIIFDNADHFDIDFQEHVYQYARSIYEREICLVILPITDRTSWQLSRQGALQSFEHEALFLPTPPTDQVIKKRIEYLNERVRLERQRPDDRYFVKQGISLKLDDLAAFTNSLQMIFLQASDTSRWIGNLANHDIRRSLKLARLFVTSPHLQVEDLLKAYLSGTAMFVGRSRAATALIRGNYAIYADGQHEFIQNVFCLTGDIETTPLLGLRILQMLSDARTGEREDALVDIDQAIQYFQSMGIEPRAVSLHVDALLKSGLIHNYDPTVTSIGQATQIEITPSGLQHLSWGINNFQYLSAMADTTPILNEEHFAQIRDSLRENRVWQRKSERFVAYILAEDSHYIHLPQHPSYLGQENMTKTLKKTLSELHQAAET